jgi:SAM-dependent methyltransferase
MQEHSSINQENYTKAPEKFNLVTAAQEQSRNLLLRDIPQHIKTYLEKNFPDRNKTISLLDFGCGTGRSAEDMIKLLASLGYNQVEIFGFDINEQNLEVAKQKLPNAKFFHIEQNKPIPEINKKFDIALLFFVSIEMQSQFLPQIFTFIRNQLKEDGLLIHANNSAKRWDPERNWLTVKAAPENERQETASSGKKKYKEDQNLKLTRKNGSFPFTDFYHSGKSYLSLYEKTGFNSQTVIKIKPKGCGTDKVEIPWLDEKEYSPFTIHIVEAKVKGPEINKNCLS